MRKSAGISWLRVIVILGFGVASAYANVIDTVAILSGSDLTGTTEWNSRSGADVVINVYPEPVWKAPAAGGKWISYGLTGPGQTSVPSVRLVEGLVVDPPTAIFYSSFYLPAPAVSGALRVWADDTASVLVDGVTRIGLVSPMNIGVWCAQAPVSCTPGTGGTVDLSGLGAGSHTIAVQAWQIWGDTFGVLYEGSVTVSAVPEPATILMFLPGLAGAIAWGRRRRQVCTHEGESASRADISGVRY